MRRPAFSSYKMPGVDSPRALANAKWFLVGARTIEHLTIETFAHQYRLKTATAARLISEEKARRNG